MMLGRNVNKTLGKNQLLRFKNGKEFRFYPSFIQGIPASHGFNSREFATRGFFSGLVSIRKP